MIDVHVHADGTDLIPMLRLEQIPRVGERIAIEDTILVGTNPTTRVRWFDVLAVVHHVALYDEDRVAGNRTRIHCVSLHLELRS